MLDLNYLQSIAPLLGVDESQISTSQGYDAMIALVSNSRDNNFPKIILEEASSGYFSASIGGMDVSTISIWVMSRTTPTSSVDSIFASTKAILIKLVKLMVRDCEDLSIDINRMPYFRRMGGMNNVGYEISITINNNISLAYE